MFLFLVQAKECIELVLNFRARFLGQGGNLLILIESAFLIGIGKGRGNGFLLQGFRIHPGLFLFLVQPKECIKFVIYFIRGNFRQCRCCFHFIKPAFFSGIGKGGLQTAIIFFNKQLIKFIIDLFCLLRFCHIR